MNSCTTYKAREFRDYQENNKRSFINQHASDGIIQDISNTQKNNVALYHNTGFYISDTIAIIALGNIKLIL